MSKAAVKSAARTSPPLRRQRAQTPQRSAVEVRPDRARISHSGVEPRGVKAVLASLEATMAAHCTRTARASSRCPRSQGEAIAVPAKPKRMARIRSRVKSGCLPPSPRRSSQDPRAEEIEKTRGLDGRRAGDGLQPSVASRNTQGLDLRRTTVAPAPAGCPASTYRGGCRSTRRRCFREHFDVIEQLHLGVAARVESLDSSLFNDEKNAHHGIVVNSCRVGSCCS